MPKAPESYSVDQLKTWEKCQKKFEFQYIKKLDWPSDPKNFRLGKGVHQLLDYASRGMDLSPILSRADDDIVAVWRRLMASSWVTYPTIASEWGFSLEVGGRWIYGRIDRIIREADGGIAILDWKTGTGVPKLPETDWQTLVYLYAVYGAQAGLGIVPPVAYTQLRFVYVHVGREDVDIFSVPYTEPMHHDIQTRLNETMSRIATANRYQLPVKCPDRYCAYGSICGIQARKAAPHSPDPDAQAE